MTAPTVEQYLLGEAQKITDRARLEGRALTPTEQKEANAFLGRIEEGRANEKLKAALYSGDFSDVPIETLRRATSVGGEKAELIRKLNGMTGAVVDEFGTGVGPSYGFGQAIKSAGFNLRERPEVTIPLGSAFGVKTSTLPDASTWNVEAPGLVALGQDSRFLYRNLQTKDAATLTAVGDFTQTARSVSGTVQRALDATSDKADVSVTVTHVVEELAEFAVTISSIPNAILESVDAMTAFLNNEGAYQVQRALDAHVVSQILAASPTTGLTGLTLVEQLRNAVGAMRDVGANPTLVAMDTETGAALDLATSGTSTPYLFPTRDTGQASPLWGLRVVESPAMTFKDVTLIDPAMLGVLYLGTLRFAADPFTEFKKNLTTLRVECRGLFHVRNAQGAYLLSGVS